MDTRELSDDKVYCFSEYQLCTRTRELVHLGEGEHSNGALDQDTLHSGSSIILEPKAMDLLIYLIENRDRVVPKPELREALWDMRPLSETVLSHCVMKARHALDDDGRRQAYIRTVRGHGYRFIAEATTKPPQDHSEESHVPAEPAPPPAVKPDPAAESQPVPESLPVTESRPAPDARMASEFQPGTEAHSTNDSGPATGTRGTRLPLRPRELVYAALALGLVFALGLLTSELGRTCLN